MSVHDALEAWQRGGLSTDRAMVLAGAMDVVELEALCEACGVEVVKSASGEPQYFDAAGLHDFDDAVREGESRIEGDS